MPRNWLGGRLGQLERRGGSPDRRPDAGRGVDQRAVKVEQDQPALQGEGIYQRFTDQMATEVAFDPGRPVAALLQRAPRRPGRDPRRRARARPGSTASESSR